MQERLIQRYLGNKSPMAEDIVSVVREIANPGDLVFDAFAGTLSVSAHLRSAGFRVAANDINHFTWTFGTAYFTQPSLPMPDTFIAGRFRDVEEAWQDAIDRLTAPYDESVPVQARRNDIFDHYCEAGSKSAFSSSRGTTGNRRFFSPENAELIDRALSRIRYWHRVVGLQEHTRCLLTATLLSAVEKVSNTQGTYHDFPREFIDPRANQRIKLRPPTSSQFKLPTSEFIGKAKDSLEYALEVPKHKVLYLDPPYNFRQYTSYYFMLNLISEYAEIDSLDSYFANIEFVRGQNMAGDFKSQFCGKNTFIPALKTLIERAKAEYVVLSYFDGRNHWGQFKSDSADLTGKALLEKFFASDTFVASSAKCLPVSRLNYQSYGGHSAKNVNEFLFVAQKRTVPAKRVDSRQAEWIGMQTETLTES